MRTSHLSPAALPVWVAAGYHPDDTAAFLAVVAESLQHPNMALGARQRGGTELEAAVADAAVAAAYNGTAPEELVQVCVGAWGRVRACVCVCVCVRYVGVCRWACWRGGV